MQDVHIHLVVRHSIEGQTEETRQKYHGKGVQKENGWYLSYKEEMEGVGDVSTVLKIGKSEVTLLRQGNLQVKQSFEKGQSSEANYNSPFGQFLMETHTRRLQIERDNDRPVHIQIAYQLWMNRQYAGDYELTLRLEWN